MKYDLTNLRTPCYIIDKGLLRRNLEILDSVQKRTGAKILLALKAFSAWGIADVVSEYLHGTSASSLYEARLGYEEFEGEVHLCAPAYRDDEFEQFCQICDHIVFNSPSQWNRFKNIVQRSGRAIDCGVRINPEHSEVKTEIYDPCAKGSRLGTNLAGLIDMDWEGISGIHFHNLCELNSDSLQRTLAVVEPKFSDIIDRMEWVNFGGGHHITREDYDVDLLCSLISDFKEKYGVQVYLEPGEAIALNTGFLAASVLDVVKNDLNIAILDTSAAAHMPDVLEMPYRPVIENADDSNTEGYTYRLAGPTCLAGDVIGDYSFNKPLEVGDKLLFHDMAHYTMVKNNMFNGISLPDIVLYDPTEADFKVQRHFGYHDFRSRLS